MRMLHNIRNNLHDSHISNQLLIICYIFILTEYTAVKKGPVNVATLLVYYVRFYNL